MPRDPLVELEAARANVLEEAERFVEELEAVLGPSLHAGFERLRRTAQGYFQKWRRYAGGLRRLD